LQFSGRERGGKGEFEPSAEETGLLQGKVWKGTLLTTGEKGGARSLFNKLKEKRMLSKKFPYRREGRKSPGFNQGGMKQPSFARKAKILIQEGKRKFVERVDYQWMFIVQGRPCTRPELLGGKRTLSENRTLVFGGEEALAEKNPRLLEKKGGVEEKFLEQ